MKPIFVLGSVSLDRFVTTSYTGVFLGGKGSNQAIAAKRAGASEVTFAGKIGADEGGQLAKSTWAHDGVDASAVRVTEAAATGRCDIVIGANGESTITRFGGANLTMTDEDVLAFAAKLPNEGIFVTQLSSTISAAESMIRLAKQRGLTVILTPAPVLTLPPDVWSCVDVITPNEAEAAQLNALPDNGANALTFKTRIVTLGANGVNVQSEGRELCIPAHSVIAVDATGCGDAFTGAFAAALADGANVYEAARFGNAAGALCSLTRGAANAMPHKTAIEAMLKGT